MSILKVARMGHPILRQVAAAVDVKDIPTATFQQFIDDMIETMREYNGLGLAAPQVHRALRVSVVEVEENPRYKNKKLSGLIVFINPEIEHLTEEMDSYWEGCLSVPGMRGLVARTNKIRVKYFDRHGQRHESVVEGFLSTVLQHEFDHLDGKLYIDRLVDTKKFSYEEEFDKYWLPEEGGDSVSD